MLLGVRGLGLTLAPLPGKKRTMITGDAKKRYQRNYMKDYMQRKRQVVKTHLLRPVQPGDGLPWDDLAGHSVMDAIELDEDGNAMPEYT